MPTPPSPAPAHSEVRVCAWWDIDIHIGQFNKRKVTARPLKELEQRLGHRLHVEGWERYRQMPPGVWKLHAYHYIDTADPTLAAITTLKSLMNVATDFSLGGYGYRPNAIHSGDLDDDTIAAFYWGKTATSNMISAGVLLHLVPHGARSWDKVRSQRTRTTIGTPCSTAALRIRRSG